MANNAVKTTSAPQSLTQSTLWLLTAKVLSFAVNIALPLIIVRRLTQVELGHYRQIFQAVNTANMVLPLGFSMTAFYFFPREPQRHREIIFNILLVYGAIGALAASVLLLYPQVLVRIFGEPALLSYAPMLALLIPLWMVSYLLEIAPIIHQEFRIATVFIMGSQISRSLLLLAAILIWRTVPALVWAAIAHAALQVIVLLTYFESRQPGFWRHFNPRLLREQVVYALPLAYSALIWGFQIDLHSYFVSNHFGAAVYAVYSIGCFQVPLIGVLSEAAVSVLLGRVAELRQQNNTHEILAVTARAVRKLSAAVLPTWAFLLVGGQELLILLFTRKYANAYPIFAVNVTNLVTLLFLMDPIIRAYPEHTHFMVKARTVLLALMAAALWYFVGRYPPISAVTIAVATTVVDRILIAIYIGRKIGFRRQDWALFRDTGLLALCGAIAAIPTAFLRQALLNLPPVLILLITGSCYVAIYAVCAVVMRIPTQEEWRQARGYLRKPLGWLRRAPENALRGA